jgi:hypothetical protein
MVGIREEYEGTATFRAAGNFYIRRADRCFVGTNFCHSDADGYSLPLFFDSTQQNLKATQQTSASGEQSFVPAQ